MIRLGFLALTKVEQMWAANQMLHRCIELDSFYPFEIVSAFNLSRTKELLLPALCYFPETACLTEGRYRTHD